MLSVTRIYALPSDIQYLLSASRREGFGHIERLVADFASGSNRFDDAGEALFDVRSHGLLVAIGGLNRDPYAQISAGRVRHLYVAPEYRRVGVGRLLMLEIESAACKTFSRINLRTDTARGARFYEALGYQQVTGETHLTHCKSCG